MTNFQFLVDWDNDGDYADTGEDITAYVMAANWQLGFTEPGQHVAGETRANLTVRNLDKRFSPDYASGAMYGDLLPKRRLQVSYVDGGTTELYNGYIESINPAPGTSGDLTASIVGVGVKQFYENESYYSPFWEDVTADVVIADIVSGVQLPAIFNNFLYIDIPGQNLIDTHWIADDTDYLASETGKTTFPYVGDTWEDGVKAIDAINDLVQSERGWFFQSREGSVVFWNRHHLISNDTIQGTVNNTWANMDYRYTGNDIKNVVRMTAYPRSIGTATDEVLWQLDEPVTVAPGETKKLRVQYTEQDSDSKISGRNVTTPNINDSSLQITPVGVSFDFNVDEDSARSMKVSIENTHTRDISIDEMVVKGQKVTTYNKQEIEKEDAISIGRYGRGVLRMDHKLISDVSFADAIVSYELGQNKDPRGVVRAITINQRLADFAVNRVIGDWVRVVDGQTSHDDEYVIMGEQWAWRPGDKFDVSYVLQPTSTLQFIFIDVTNKNDIDGGRYIAV